MNHPHFISVNKVFHNALSYFTSKLLYFKSRIRPNFNANPNHIHFIDNRHILPTSTSFIQINACRSIIGVFQSISTYHSTTQVISCSINYLLCPLHFSCKNVSHVHSVYCMTFCLSLLISDHNY